MKRKLSIILNIAMLCLCVCAIAFGVYSAQQARLNISGNLGFTAHNAFVSVTGFVRNVAQIENDNVVGKTDMQIDKIVKGADTADPVNITIPLGDMYFYSNNNVSAEDIVFELTFTNIGKTDVLATITKPTIATSVSVVDNSDNNHGLYISFGETGEHQLGIYKGESQTISFAMHLNDMSTLSSKVSFNIPINFEEWIYKIGVTVKEFTSGPTGEKETIKSQLGSAGSVSYSDTIKCYAERFPYYIEMGTDPTNTYSTGKLRWLIVGIDDGSGQMQKLDAFATNEHTTAFKAGKMLNKNYYLLSEKVLYTENTTNYGISFQNAYTQSSPYLNTKYGVKANDYATSNVREYLKGNTVQRAAAKDSNGTYKAYGTPVNFLTTYNLTNDPLYSRIQARTLASLYNESAISGETAEMKTVPTSTTSTPVDTTSDKFWLLSQTEMETIFVDDKSDNYYMSARTSVLGDTSAAYWWLRSPSYNQPIGARYVLNIGDLHGNTVYRDTRGVRAAFKI